MADQDSTARVPFQKRWELLKPVIEKLWFDDRLELRGMAKFMKENYDFDAKLVARNVLATRIRLTQWY